MSILKLSLNRVLTHLFTFSKTGLIGAGAFFALSMEPSLIPRNPIIQGVLSGLAAAIGYWLGMAIAWVWAFLEIPTLSGRAAKLVGYLAAALAVAFVAYALWRGADWQDGLRAFLGLPPLETIYTPVVLAVAVPLAFLLREIGRLFAWLARLIAGVLNRIIPRKVSLSIGIVVAAFLLVNLASGTIGRMSLRSMDSMFQALDELIDPEFARPTDDLVTGSAKSLVSWENLGRQGRRFVGSGPSAANIEDFTGSPAKRPIRVYVGLNAAETVEERAALALEEMKRVGAFDRSVLVIATPTGTGWVDEAAIDPLEYLHNGDTATVALQYSYLTSYVSLLVEPGYSRAAASALFNAVYDHWRRLPADTRPRLYLHGLSLGSSGSAQSLNIFSVLGDLINGAVWSGPPFTNPSWQEFTQRRDPDSLYWLPRYGDGSLVRFTNQQNRLDIPGAEWGPMRIVFLQYASDPITFFSTDLFYKEPEWLKGERGPDVSPALDWTPIVTGLQVAFDMVGASAIGPGLGHLYAADHYINAWVAVTQPEGWSDADIGRLKRHFKDTEDVRLFD